MFDIQENLKKLPDCPGVYIHKDRLGQVIYVGKAVSLKNRVRQYFQTSYRNSSLKVKTMVSEIAEFEYIRCGSEMEALILECNLIKKYMPKFNVLLRDDKTYPYIVVTTSEQFPRVLKTRHLKKDGNRYFGPYSDVGAVNHIVDLFNSMFSLKRCSAVSFSGGHRPCLNYHIEACRGICRGSVSAAVIPGIQDKRGLKLVEYEPHAFLRHADVYRHIEIAAVHDAHKTHDGQRVAVYKHRRRLRSPKPRSVFRRNTQRLCESCPYALCAA